ncbi:MAG TPA: penicillin-binding transpeptidase domain-containing protein, partial [Anaerolineaceae bacterium]|nr:penicillin-binding transpeptidase domain-containing protein [Anaerolineaceae bacterium]
AVKALEFVGIYDNPATVEADGLIAFARRLGISTLVRNDYGLSLTLGGGEVTLFDMTSAFSVFANNGRRVEPVAITRIEDHKGKIIYESKPREPEQVMRAEHAYLITSILSDAMARAPMFGSDSILNLPFPAAVKTGTTNEYRDNWTIGYTPDLVTGVWVGNADNSPMVGTSGVSGAAPIWNAFMNSAIPYLTGNAPANFTRPEGIVEKEICVYSGAEPSENCTERRRELFAFDQPPPSSEDDLWKLVKVDTWTNLKASSACEGFAETKLVLNVSDKWAKKWIDDTDQGRAWLEKINFSPPVIYVPSRECRADDPRPTLLFVGLNDGQTITTDKLDIYAVVDATKNFKEYYLEYGEGKDPHKWTTLVEPGGETSADPQKLLTWDLLKVNNGVVTLRLFMLSTKNGHAEKLLRLNLQVPTPTPTNTPTPTETPTITPTPTSTATPTPTLTLTPMPLFPTLDAFLQTLLPPGN